MNYRVGYFLIVRLENGSLIIKKFDYEDYVDCYSLYKKYQSLSSAILELKVYRRIVYKDGSKNTSLRHHWSLSKGVIFDWSKK